MASERGHADHGWLDSRHTFSFADYYDPQHMGFRALRVINEDRVAPGQGFGTHGHRDMEILSYVLEGELAHKDSMGTGSVIRPGDVQRMSAGSGVRHSEFNASKIEVVHFLQIWVLPDKEGIAPGYEQKHFTNVEKQGRLRLIASPDAQDGSVTIHADARVYAGRFGHEQSAALALPEGRHAWVHVARGHAWVAGHELSAGDAVGLSGEKTVEVHGLDRGDDAEVLVFDLA
ncbi:MAG TPA: pirin family protein [Polyangia bacterium]|nr:pirin family protein [Polyangia bacterium]